MKSKMSERFRMWVVLLLLIGTPAKIATAEPDYEDALEKSILYFEGQRSGKLPPDQRMRWRSDSALRDGSDQNVDLVGGYYDAGDNVKFGFPMAFSMTMLSWSVIEFGKRMGPQLEHAMDAIRWGTDYLLKAASAEPDTLYVQVGEPNRDHQCWERSEDMDTPRTSYKITKDKPGSEVAAETAAAMAAASIVFEPSNKAYANRLLTTAIRLFNFADKYRGSYTNSVGDGACPFYCSNNGYMDELLWGAAWLRKATKNITYLDYIQKNGVSFGMDDQITEFGWDNKDAGVHVILSREFLVGKVAFMQSFKNYADDFICSVMPETVMSSAHVPLTPGGLIYKAKGSNMQTVTAISFLLLVYASHLGRAGTVASCGNMEITPTELRLAAKRQVDYILGENPLALSYMVGYGRFYPRYIHHRGSSIPDIKTHPAPIECGLGFTEYFYSQYPNPNDLVGAVVGGPDINDNYHDNRMIAGQSEPTTYINAPLVGVLAFLNAHPQF